MALDLLILGLCITLEPLPLTAFMVVLASERGVRKAAAFIFGWLVSLAIVIALTLALTSNAPPKPSTGPSIAISVVKLLLGVLLLYVAARQRRKMGQPKKQKPPPKWQAKVDSMSVWFAMGLAALVQPWGLVGAGAATIAEAHLASWKDYVTIILFAFVSTGVYIGLEVFVGFWPEKGQAWLTSLRNWISTHTDQVIIIVSLVAGFWLIGKSVYALAT
jgi:hypothetical protein